MTRLTVPVSNARPGRAARPVAQPAGGAAEGLADFGEVMFRVGAGLERERLDSEMQRNQVDLMEGFAGLRASVVGQDDPDAAAVAWEAGVADLRQRFLEPGEGGRAAVDPANVERFGITFDTLRLRHEGVFGRELVAARTALRERRSDEVMRAGRDMFVRSADPQLRAAALEQVNDHLAREVQSGRLSAQEAQGRRDNWLAQAETDLVLAAVDADDEEAYAPAEPDPALAVEIAIARDPDAARLARAVGYVSDSPGAVAEMQARLDDMAQMDMAGRDAWVARLVDERGVRLRAGLAMPRFLTGEATRDGLRDAAERLVAAHRAGHLAAGEYEQEARRVQAMWRTYDER